MTRVGDKLVYTESDSGPEFSFNCKLEFSLHDNKLTISDSNFDCSNWVFTCGARVGLDGVELPKVSQTCPVSD
ncbi:hypothetical protein [Veronia nyctiphanis]|nr:hypothetical protein [Veronia nyctiphanis]